MEGEMKAGGGMKCSCPHHKAIPALVILFGLLFLLEALGSVSMRTVSIIWPLIVIVAGIMKWTAKGCKCCSGGMCMTC